MGIDRNETALSVKHEEEFTIVEDVFPEIVTFFGYCLVLYA